MIRSYNHVAHKCDSSKGYALPTMMKTGRATIDSGEEHLLDVDSCERALKDQIDILARHKAEATTVDLQFVRIHAAMIMQMADHIMYVQGIKAVATSTWEPGP
jgi:hypothetical protein